MGVTTPAIRRLATLAAVGWLAVGLAVGCAGGPDETEGAGETADRSSVELRDSPIIPVADSPVRGGDDAWVTVVVFADFACPFSGRLAKTLEEVRAQYEDRTVRIVFKHVPLDHHQGAEPAARAAEAAGRQGQFWQMHDALFENPARLRGDETTDQLVELARKLGLDEEQFRADIESPEVAARIEEDRRLARQLGVDNIPSVFVSGGRISGARSAEVYRAAIDNVDEILRHGVLEGDIERRDVYRDSVEILYDRQDSTGQ